MSIKNKLSILMPCYNEGKDIYGNLVETIETINNMQVDFEIIAINDGSVDDTLNEIKIAAKDFSNIIVVNLEKNQGKGEALKQGFKFCNGEYVAFLDSDLELHPRQLKRFFDIMKNENADVVIGSKAHKESISNYPSRRKIISFGYYIVLRLLFRLPIKDTQTGIKLFKHKALENIFPKLLVKRYAFDIELLANINYRGFKIVDAPIELNFKRENGWGRIKINDVFRMLIDTLAIFYRIYILKYYDKINDDSNITYYEIAAAKEDSNINKEEK